MPQKKIEVHGTNMHVEIFLILGCVVRPFSEMFEWNITIKKNQNLKTILLNDVETSPQKMNCIRILQRKENRNKTLESHNFNHFKQKFCNG